MRAIFRTSTRLIEEKRGGAHDELVANVHPLALPAADPALLHRPDDAVAHVRDLKQQQRLRHDVANESVVLPLEREAKPSVEDEVFFLQTESARGGVGGWVLWG